MHLICTHNKLISIIVHTLVHYQQIDLMTAVFAFIASEGLWVWGAPLLHRGAMCYLYLVSHFFAPALHCLSLTKRSQVPFEMTSAFQFPFHLLLHLCTRCMHLKVHPKFRFERLPWVSTVDAYDAAAPQSRESDVFFYLVFPEEDAPVFEMRAPLAVKPRSQQTSRASNASHWLEVEREGLPCFCCCCCCSLCLSKTHMTDHAKCVCTFASVSDEWHPA